jgi:hypothetical protein
LLLQLLNFAQGCVGLRDKMPIFVKPHFTLKVEQPTSAFADGNARW